VHPRHQRPVAAPREARRSAPRRGVQDVHLVPRRRFPERRFPRRRSFPVQGIVIPLGAPLRLEQRELTLERREQLERQLQLLGQRFCPALELLPLRVYSGVEVPTMPSVELPGLEVTPEPVEQRPQLDAGSWLTVARARLARYLAMRPSIITSSRGLLRVAHLTGFEPAFSSAQGWCFLTRELPLPPQHVSPTSTPWRAIGYECSFISFSVGVILPG
jgi:hypothetical protein